MDDCMRRKILREDVPEQYHDILDAVGMDAFLALVELCGGINLYLPKEEMILKSARNREILARFDGGNYRLLARQFRLSDRQVRKIVKGEV